MMTRDLMIRSLFEKLSLLCKFSPKTKEELSSWYEQARQIEVEITQPGGLSADVPNFLWSYLSDADIRMKDSVYATLQNAQIELLLNKLEEGIVPDDKDLIRDVQTR